MGDTGTADIEVRTPKVRAFQTARTADGRGRLGKTRSLGYDGAVSWEPEVDEIRRRVELAKQMGGEANVERQHAGGKLTIRERIERLVDAGTLHETGALTGKSTYE